MGKKGKNDVEQVWVLVFFSFSTPRVPRDLFPPPLLEQYARKQGAADDRHVCVCSARPSVCIRICIFAWWQVFVHPSRTRRCVGRVDAFGAPACQIASRLKVRLRQQSRLLIMRSDRKTRSGRNSLRYHMYQVSDTTAAVVSNALYNTIL